MLSSFQLKIFKIGSFLNCTLSSRTTESLKKKKESVGNEGQADVQNTNNFKI